MATLKADITRSIEELPALERIALVEKILESLDATDPAMDLLWANEASDRLDALKSGALKSVPAHEIFPEL